MTGQQAVEISPQNRIARNGAVVAAVLLYFFLAVSSLLGDSPTMDEQNHIARGLAFLRSGDPRLSLEHPPLVNSLSASLLLTEPGLTLPFDHPSWERREGWYEFADLFLWQYNEDVDRIVFLARMPVVFLGLGLALVGFAFARTFWGGGAAVLAFLLFLFEPNLLAHTRYATTDLGAIFFSFLATYALYIMWGTGSKWSWKLWLFASLTMGLSFAAKLSTLGFVPVWLLLAVLPLYPDIDDSSSWRRSGRRLVQLLTAGIASLAVIWLIFGAEWGPVDFVSPLVSGLNTGSWPMPTFWEGLEQMLLLGGGRASTFLLGQFSDSGFVSYYPVAFLVKTPLALLGLILLAGILLLRDGRTRRISIFLLVSAFGYAAIVSLSKLNIGYRHVLPALPYLLVLASGIGSARVPSFSMSGLPGRRIVGGLTAILVTVFIATTLWIYPNFLSYFNVVAGGPENGYHVLVDSNIDWGQDLLRLRTWMDENEVEKVKLGWFGTADPGYYDINYDPLPGLGRDEFFSLWWDVPFNREAPEPGTYAISASNIWELPLTGDEKTVYAWFRDRPPDDRVGYSILIYDVP